MTFHAHPDMAAVDSKAKIFMTNPFHIPTWTAPYGKKNSKTLCEKDFFVNLPTIQLTGVVTKSAFSDLRQPTAAQKKYWNK